MQMSRAEDEGNARGGCAGGTERREWRGFRF